mmetsp:Transcript_33093/g.106894  ORF Transcript_33093/g.106894 Transcript_33093/m.106894 type:complete len:356 (-) Transcript_33093:831-1898(-)
MDAEAAGGGCQLLLPLLLRLRGGDRRQIWSCARNSGRSCRSRVRGRARRYGRSKHRRKGRHTRGNGQQRRSPRGDGQSEASRHRTLRIAHRGVAPPTPSWALPLGRQGVLQDEGRAQRLWLPRPWRRPAHGTRLQLRARVPMRHDGSADARKASLRDGLAGRLAAPARQLADASGRTLARGGAAPLGAGRLEGALERLLQAARRLRGEGVEQRLRLGVLPVPQLRQRQRRGRADRLARHIPDPHRRLRRERCGGSSGGTAAAPCAAQLRLPPLGRAPRSLRRRGRRGGPLPSGRRLCPPGTRLSAGPRLLQHRVDAVREAGAAAAGRLGGAQVGRAPLERAAEARLGRGADLTQL